jgi:Bacterial regulatory proteins, tetR family
MRMRSQAAATPRLGSPRGATYVALTDWVGQYYMAHMVRRTPEHRFQDLLDAATRVFIAQGYRRTQVADVAEAMRVAKGTVYLYVESKEALFDAALRYADAPGPVPECSDVCGDGQGDEDSRGHPGAGPKPSPAASERTPRDARSIVWASLKVSPKDG